MAARESIGQGGSAGSRWWRWSSTDVLKVAALACGFAWGAVLFTSVVNGLVGRDELDPGRTDAVIGALSGAAWLAAMASTLLCGALLVVAAGISLRTGKRPLVAGAIVLVAVAGVVALWVFVNQAPCDPAGGNETEHSAVWSAAFFGGAGACALAAAAIAGVAVRGGVGGRIAAGAGAGLVVLIAAFVIAFSAWVNAACTP
jgi:hypothetical protein